MLSDAQDTHLTRDDDQAIRIASLALAFTNASKPLSTNDIRRNHYAEDLDNEAFSRAFRRDRQALAACGVVVEQAEAANGEVAWQVDTSKTLAGSERLTPHDALLLVAACSPVAADPSFAYSDELRMALAKVARSFEDLAPNVPAAGSSTSKVLDEVRACLEARCPVKVEYARADGTSSSRVLAPLGLFGLRAHVYVVAQEYDNDLLVGEQKTYRIDRVASAKRVEGSYTIPEDFSVQDHISLPFQLGEQVAVARFLVPAERVDDVRKDARGKGVWSREEDGYVWEVEVADISACATWAIAEGIRPLSPPALCDAWIGLLEEVVANA